MRIPRRLAWRLVPPLALVLLALALTAGMAVRGTWADEKERDPASAAEGPVTQLVRGPDGQVEARCAAVLPFALEEVWQVLTDYENFGDVCTCLRADRLEHDPAGTCRLAARASNGLGGFVPFEVDLISEQELDRYAILWDQPSGHVLVNRGRWVLRPVGPGQTLVALSLEVQVRGVPTFILRNQSLGRVREVVGGLERRLRSGSAGKPW